MKAEQFIRDYTRKCSNELCAVEDRYGKKVISYHEWLTPDQALSAVKIAREEIMAKVCEWLEKHSHNYMVLHDDKDSSFVTFDSNWLVDNLKKAMEE